MPLGKIVSENIKELMDKNTERKSRGIKPRKRSQIIAIAMEASRKAKGA